MVAECGLHAPLSLRLLLGLRLAELSSVSSPMEWLPTAVECVRACASCRVHAAREFELVPLWMLVVELVCDDRWLAEYSAAAEAVSAFQRSLATAIGLLSAAELLLHGSLWDSFGKDPPPPLQLPACQLAARAVLAYLALALDAKAAGTLRAPPCVVMSCTPGGGKGASELDALLRAGQPSQYALGGSGAYAAKGFEPFFGALQAMAARGDGVALAEFKREVVRTLLPMAPYLCGL